MGRRYSLAARRVVRGCRRMAESKEGLGSRSSKVVRQEQAPWVMETLDRQTGLPTHTHTRTKRRRVTRSLEICCLSLLLLLLLNGAHSLPTNDDARKKEKEPRVRRFITICSFSSIKFIICTMFLRMRFGKGKFSMTRFRLSDRFNRYRTFIRRCYFFFFSLKNLLPNTSMILSYPTSFNIEPRHEL